MRNTLVGVVAILAFFLFLGSGIVAWQMSPAANIGNEDFNVVRWEFNHFGNKWLYETGRLIRGDTPSVVEQDRDVQRYFTLNREIRALEQQLAQQERERGSIDSVDPELRRQLADSRSERSNLQSDVEAAIEGRLTEVLKSEGLTVGLPFGAGPRIVWPPVDITFEQPSRVLVTSPRDRIAVLATRFVRAGLPLNDILEIERRTEAEGPNISALVIGVGGYATYPAVIPEGVEYYTAIETIAHEWTHHYLAFHPLGQRYFVSRDLQTINETVADVSGQDLAKLYNDRFPLDLPPAPAANPGAIDVQAELRALRIAVEESLQNGRVEEAETLMVEKRRELANSGLYLRRINQAYFAFHGSYAESPLSISTLGPRIRAVRSSSRSLSDFLSRISSVTSVAALDELVDSASGAGLPLSR
jgi:hypothetical protein